MLKYYNYDIVFQEIPDELTLAINITNCPNRCKGCHSPHLQSNIGEYLNESFIDSLFSKYGSAISCFCFMGGDNNPAKVAELARYVKDTYPHIKTAWYSGCADLPKEFDSLSFNYIKIGEYIENLGGLDNKKSNQRLYEILPNGDFKNISEKFFQNMRTIAI